MALAQLPPPSFQAEQAMVVLTRLADKGQRGLDKPLRLRIRDCILRIAQSPELQGEKLVSPLLGVYSHHLTYQGKEYRIAYEYLMDENRVIILLIAPHENFYRRLKQLMYG